MLQLFRQVEAESWRRHVKQEVSSGSALGKGPVWLNVARYENEKCCWRLQTAALLGLQLWSQTGGTSSANHSPPPAGGRPSHLGGGARLKLHFLFSLRPAGLEALLLLPVTIVTPYFTASRYFSTPSLPVQSLWLPVRILCGLMFTAASGDCGIITT